MSFVHHYINVIFSPRRLEPVDSLWNPAIYWCVWGWSIDFCCKECWSQWSVCGVCCFSHSLSAEIKPHPRQQNVRKPKLARLLILKFLLKSETSRNCNPMLRRETEALHRSCVWIALFLCFRSGDVQRAIPPRLDRVLPLWQRHAHQEPERLGNAQRGQSREPEWVDVARRPSPGLGSNHENLTSSRAWIQADTYHWQTVQD